MSRRLLPFKDVAGPRVTSTSSGIPTAQSSCLSSKVSQKKREDCIDYDMAFIPDAALVSPRELVANLGRLSRISTYIDPTLLLKYIGKALALAESNEISCKDFVNFLHSLSRLNHNALKDIDICPLLNELRIKLKKNRRFKQALTPVDIAVCLNSFTRLKESSVKTYSICKEVVMVLCDEVPCRIHHFDDHHLAVILHCLSKFNIRDPVIISDVISEIELSRTLVNFTLQSTIIIATACSQLDILSLIPKESFVVQGMWESIQSKLANAKSHELQPEWASVALACVSKSGIPQSLVTPQFVHAMVEDVIFQTKAGRLDGERVNKAIIALTKLNIHGDVISRLGTYRKLQ